jgi:1,4-dihydroxy-6-naphthoate synthase
VRLGFSPCPNDTFVFHALAESGAFETVIDDVEALNAMAERGGIDVVKISVAAFGRLREEYGLLRSGGAAGFGTGPILVAREPRVPGGKVAIPGERTTAALLLRMLGRFQTVPMRFDRIEDAILRGDVDCGVLIHEGRFTYAEKGLRLLADLGSVWEGLLRLPVPLGAIAIRRELGPGIAREVDQSIRASVERARARPADSAEFVRRHAREMDPGTIRRHIDLYVNDYTLALDEPAVRALLRFGEEQGFFPPSEAPLFAW